jgi:hypothetical protein
MRPIARLVLAVSVAALAAGTAAAAPGGAQPLAVGVAVAPGSPRAKKDELVAPDALDPGRRAADRRALDRRIGRPAEAVVNVVNTWTDEVLVLAASPGSAGPDVPTTAIDRFLRCHFTNQPTAMDARLFETVVRAARHFGARRVEIVSGFRAPKYNLMLRKKGHEVARDSQHTQGHAVDFRLPGVPVAKLRAWARRLRLGGVGYYPDSGFVHVDVGPLRQWGGE